MDPRLQKRLIDEAVEKFGVVDMSSKAHREKAFYLLPDGRFLSRTNNGKREQESAHVDVDSLESMKKIMSLPENETYFSDAIFCRATGAFSVIPPSGERSCIYIFTNPTTLPTDQQIDSIIDITPSTKGYVCLIPSYDGLPENITLEDKKVALDTKEVRADFQSVIEEYKRHKASSLTI